MTAYAFRDYPPDLVSAVLPGMMVFPGAGIGAAFGYGLRQLIKWYQNQR